MIPAQCNAAVSAVRKSMRHVIRSCIIQAIDFHLMSQMRVCASLSVRWESYINAKKVCREKVVIPDSISTYAQSEGLASAKSLVARYGHWRLPVWPTLSMVRKKVGRAWAEWIWSAGVPARTAIRATVLLMERIDNLSLRPIPVPWQTWENLMKPAVRTISRDAILQL